MTEPRVLTQPENDVLSFVVEYIERHGYPPSIREIGEGVGRGTTTVHATLRRLQAKGWISVERGQPRTLRVVAS